MRQVNLSTNRQQRPATIREHVSSEWWETASSRFANAVSNNA
jgi:hypothetical protein